MNKEKIGILTQLQGIRETRPGPFWATLGVAGISLFGMVAAFGTAPSTMAALESRAQPQTVVEQLAPQVVTSQENTNDFFVREERIQRGDSVASLLTRLGIQNTTVFQFLREDRASQVIFKQLRPGKLVTAHVSESGELQKLIYPLNGTDRGRERSLFVESHNGRLQASEQTLDLDTQVLMKSGEIRYSLFGATDAAGLPDSVAVQLADIFGGDIDFHRDIRRGDRFSVIYATGTYLGKPVQTGRILAAEFVNNGKTHRAIWFEDSETNGETKGGYYTPDGKNIRKAFLRSPLEFSRITSGFTSARFHPIIHQWRAHKGIDYGAPVGTRVKSTGDGVVEFAGNQGGYGRLVVIRHQSSYKTAYGHLSGFANGMRKGVRIAQGDVIGFVGSSGLSTGPHLHYEFRVNDVHRTPLAMALPEAPPLAAQQLGRFNALAQPQTDRLDLIKSSNLALLE